jgi:hypothetical protein
MAMNSTFKLKNIQQILEPFGDFSAVHWDSVVFEVLMFM